MIKTITNILKELQSQFKGVKAYVVGGWVRDTLMQKESKDIDIEVFGLSFEDLNTFLKKYGDVSIVGKAFGVCNLRTPEGTVDFSLPRKDNKIGIGHKDFEITVEKNMTLEEAAKRRDFTINSLSYDPVNDVTFDYYGGQKDISDKILKHISPAFVEDPLRVLRGMQFQARFDLDININTMQLMKEVFKAEYNTIPLERISEEWMKWSIKGYAWHRVFEFFRQLDATEYPYSDLLELKKTQQDPGWHPEGDVEVHTQHVLVAMGEILEREKIYGEDRAVLVFAALLHDISKPECTKIEEVRGKNRITSKGHEGLGADKANVFLYNIGIKKELRDRICPIIGHHLIHINLDSIDNEKSKLRFVMRLARKMYPATIRELLLLIEADCSGRPPLPKSLPDSAKELDIIYSNMDELKRLAIEAKVQDKPIDPIIKGRHLIILGLEPGPIFKEILNKALDAQEAGEFKTEEEGIIYVKGLI